MPRKIFSSDEVYELLDDMRRIADCLQRAEEALNCGDEEGALEAIGEAMEIAQYWV